MADKVFIGTVVLPDRIIDNGYVLVADGVVHRVGEEPAPAGEHHGGAGFLVLPGAMTGRCIAAAKPVRRTSSGRPAAPRREA